MNWKNSLLHKEIHRKICRISLEHYLHDKKTILYAICEKIILYEIVWRSFCAILDKFCVNEWVLSEI